MAQVGLVEGLGKIGKKVIGAIRQPSGGPTFNIKGSAAGGGLAQCIPLTPFSLGLTGDINNIMNSHNLGMVALTSRMQHEHNYGDKFLAKRDKADGSITATLIVVGGGERSLLFQQEQLGEAEFRQAVHAFETGYLPPGVLSPPLVVPLEEWRRYSEEGPFTEM